ncbi:MAG: hypothetical protein ACXADL_16795, partial [Candidatus Thorarchaeota archaeon]
MSLGILLYVSGFVPTAFSVKIYWLPWAYKPDAMFVLYAKRASTNSSSIGIVVSFGSPFIFVPAKF